MARARCASLDLGGSIANTPVLDTLEEHPPQTPTSALIYSNVGELRAHLVPTKASRGDGAKRAPLQPSHDPLPPPLPQKQLQRAESLPEPGTRQPYHRDPPPRLSSPWPQHKDGAPRKPLTKSQSLGDTRGVVLMPNLADLTFGTGDAVLGPILQGLEDRTGLCEAMVGCHAAGLARLCARAMEGLMGSWGGLQAKMAGQGWAVLRVLQEEPCCQSGDAWYYRVGVTFRKEQLELAAKGHPCLDNRCQCFTTLIIENFFLISNLISCSKLFQHAPKGAGELMHYARVLKPGCCSTEMQSSLGSHCSIQRIISRFTDRLPGVLVLPGHPGEQGLSPGCPAVPRVLQVLLSPDVPYQTLAGFVESSRALHRSSPGHYERLACLLLLQLCTGLEHLRVQNVGQGDICPENLLLVQCPCPPGSQQDKEGSVGLSLPRLLISNFFKVKDKTRPCSTSQEWDWTKGSAALPTPMADELNVGMLIYKILHVDISLENALDLRRNQLPAIPSLSIYSTGLKHLTTLLLHRDPCKRVSIKEARHILQVLLWGPRQELFAKSRKTLALLQSWLEMKRALLLLKLAEKAAAGSPGLEDWLCCQYFVEATEHMLYQVTQTLYTP